MRSTVLFTTIALMGIASLAPASAENASASDAYRAMLKVSGFLLRSSAACDAKMARRAAKVAMRYASAGELVAFSKAFPKTYEEWWRAGADQFNQGVMKSGMRATCAEAADMVREAP